MKRINIGLHLLLVFTLANVFTAKSMTTLTATSGSHEYEYYSDENDGTFYDTIYINTGTSKSIFLSISPNFDGADQINIYQINGSGVDELMYSSSENTYYELETLYTNGKIKIIIMTNFYPGDYGYNSIYFSYNTTTRSNLSNGDAVIAGKLGIGVSNPQAKLHVAGAIRGGETQGALGVSTTLGNVRVGQTSGYDITTDRSYFLFDKELRSSIGKIGSSVTKDLILTTGGTTRMTIKNTNGNVGIGTTSPSQSLNVRGNISVYPSGTTPVETNNGNLMITKPAASGQYINLSRSGNASWSIGTVYNTNTFAIGQGNATDASFTNAALRIATTGNIGVGADPTNNKLEVAATNGDGILIGKIGDTGNLTVALDSIASIYNLDFSGYRDVELNQVGARISAVRYNNHLANNALVQKTGLSFSTNPTGLYTGTTGLVQRMIILPNGNVGIGASRPAYKLEVAGTIHAKAVVVDLNGYADFVFEKGYQLPKLSQVEDFIKTNGHLPDVPSAKEAKENGINLVDMQVKLLQKVEELTLYALDQQKILEEQQKQIEQLEKRLKGVK
jgi:hypothetical protein